MSIPTGPKYPLPPGHYRFDDDDDSRYEYEPTIFDIIAIVIITVFIIGSLILAML